MSANSSKAGSDTGTGARTGVAKSPVKGAANSSVNHSAQSPAQRTVNGATRPGAADAAASGAPPALLERIGRHVLLSLVLIWGLGSAVVLGVGNHFVAEAFDRALLDDAHALAAHVRGGERDESNGGASPLRIDLTPRELGLLRFDQSETVWFAVYGPGGAYLAGDAQLAASPIAAPATHALSTLLRDKLELRRVTLRIDGPQPFTVVMAQTTAERTQLLRRLLMYSGLAQIWLLIALGAWLLRGIERDLQPLSDLQNAMDHRDAADLQPLPQALTQDAATRDVQRLGEALDRLLARVQQSVHAQREFAGNVAHELRTPLAGIRAQAAHALAQDDPQVWRAELQGIAQAELRASRTVDQLLALARAFESGIALSVQTIALDNVVRDTLLRYLPRADTMGGGLGCRRLGRCVGQHRERSRGRRRDGARQPGVDRRHLEQPAGQRPALWPGRAAPHHRRPAHRGRLRGSASHRQRPRRDHRSGPTSAATLGPRRTRPAARPRRRTGFVHRCAVCTAHGRPTGDRHH